MSSNKFVVDIADVSAKAKEIRDRWTPKEEMDASMLAVCAMKQHGLSPAFEVSNTEEAIVDGLSMGIALAAIAVQRVMEENPHEALLREWIGEEVTIFPYPGIMMCGRLKEGYVGDDPWWCEPCDDEIHEPKQFLAMASTASGMAVWRRPMSTEASDGFTVDSADGFVFFRAAQVVSTASDIDGPEIYLKFTEDEPSDEEADVVEMTVENRLSALKGARVVAHDRNVSVMGTLKSGPGDLYIISTELATAYFRAADVWRFAGHNLIYLVGRKAWPSQ